MCFRLTKMQLLFQNKTALTVPVVNEPHDAFML